MAQFTAGFITALMVVFTIIAVISSLSLIKKTSQQDEDWHWEREL